MVLRARIRRGECTAQEVGALDAAGLLPRDEPVEDRRRPRSFVPVMPAAFEALADAEDLSADAQYVLLRLLLVADWRFAETSLGVRALGTLTRLPWRRLRAALDELDRKDVIEARHSRGHGGSVLILAYPDVVHRPPARRAALLEHLAEAQSRTSRQRAGQAADPGDTPARASEPVIADVATATRGNGVIADVATTQSRTSRHTVADVATASRDRPSVSEDDLVAGESRENGSGPPGADVWRFDGDGQEGVNNLAPPPDECAGCVEPEESWLTDRTWMYPAIQEALT